MRLRMSGRGTNDSHQASMRDMMCIVTAYERVEGIEAAGPIRAASNVVHARRTFLCGYASHLIKVEQQALAVRTHDARRIP
eukprot:7289144-Prymnesium_polylepis.1